MTSRGSKEQNHSLEKNLNLDNVLGRGVGERGGSKRLQCNVIKIPILNIWYFFCLETSRA